MDVGGGLSMNFNISKAFDDTILEARIEARLYDPLRALLDPSDDERLVSCKRIREVHIIE
jgi:hypothetical protein